MVLGEATAVRLGLVLLCEILRVVRRIGAEAALTPPFLPIRPRLLALAGLCLFLGLLRVLLRMCRPLPMTVVILVILDLMLVQVELNVHALFNRVVKVDVCVMLKAASVAILVLLSYHVALINDHIMLATFIIIIIIIIIKTIIIIIVVHRLRSIIRKVSVNLHEVVMLDLLAHLAAPSEIAQFSFFHNV